MKNQYWVLIHGIIIVTISITQAVLIKGVLPKFSNDFTKVNIGWTIVVVLLLFDIFYFYYSRKQAIKSTQKNLLDRLCKDIFNEFIHSEPTLENSDFRVSIFLVLEKYVLLRPRKVENWNKFNRFIYNYLRIFKWKYKKTKVLKNFGRFQLRGDSKLSKILFLKGEGVVGLSYKHGTKFIKAIDEYDNDAQYRNQQHTDLNIPMFKAKKLKDEFSKYLGCPIAHYNNEGYYAVVMIDSLKNSYNFSKNFQNLENHLHGYSSFFLNPKSN